MQTSIDEVKAKHESRLMRISGVVSVGIGQDAERKAVIVIGVESDDIRIKSALPEELDGYPVKIQVMGKIRAH